MAISATADTNHFAAPPDAIARGLQFLQKEAYQWKDSKRCAACHHAATVVWTFNEARAHGYRVDEQALSEITQWAFGDMKTNSLTEQAPPRNVVNLGWVYVLLGSETASKPASLASTNQEAIVSARQTLLQQIVSKQASDGSWGRPLDERVPLGGPMEDVAILCRLALLQSSDPSKEVRDCIHKADAWLSTNGDKTSRQGRNLRLLTAACEGKQTSELAPITASIISEQNSDGGWSQTSDMPSDAYATGQTLYVLVRAGINPSAPELQRGVQFLARTQSQEGSWPMTSRVHAKNLSPITGAGTAWAVLGLIRASL